MLAKFPALVGQSDVMAIRLFSNESRIARPAATHGCVKQTKKVASTWRSADYQGFDSIRIGRSRLTWELLQFSRSSLTSAFGSDRYRARVSKITWSVLIRYENSPLYLILHAVSKLAS
jgi:hypothetical protein